MYIFLGLLLSVFYNKKKNYYQNQKTGFGIFANGETLTSSGGGSHALASSNAVIAAEVDKGSGTVLFLENRNPISRSATQIEDIKLILEF